MIQVRKSSNIIIHNHIGNHHELIKQAGQLGFGHIGFISPILRHGNVVKIMPPVAPEWNCRVVAPQAHFDPVWGLAKYVLSVSVRHWPP